MKMILITGAAGFIGFHLAKRILCEKQDVRVIGIDSMTDYYDVSLKESRLQELAKFQNFTFIKGDIADWPLVQEVFLEYQPQIVVNLAAQAGVRYSIDNPDAYISSNLIGFYNILEACRHSYDAGGADPKNSYLGVEHLVFASSSSVYGSNEKVPYSTEDRVDSPVSLYAATKKSNELMAHAYSKLYGIPCTGLRFFTVYGPLGRPDMAYFKFTSKMIKGEKIQIYNYGDMKRDFTYIDDIITGVGKVMEKPPVENGQGVRYKIYNIGNHKPESLLHFVKVLEQCLRDAGVIDKEARKELLPMQPGDVYQTYADIEDLKKDFGFCPDTPLEDGLRRFVKWYKEYYT
ncbi:MAG: NAD-dependent epimerase/dehydratase family protein [Eubacterium sp.]|nr:NAD-dependent epimerase/dehydratase family protein [Eubacterium sp.]